MSDEHGSFLVSRKAFLPVEKGGDVLWNKPREFSEWEAWEYLFARAAYSPHPWSLRKGGVVQLRRGETPPLAVRYLAERWGWGRNRVHRFLSMLEHDLDRISGQQRTADGDTYLIVKYETYQRVGDSGGTQAGTAAGQRRDKREPTTYSSYAGEVENEQQAQVAMWHDFDQRAQGLTSHELAKAQAIVRSIIEGDLYKAWETATGDRVPWTERPRLFRIALDERSATGGKLYNVLRYVVIPREYDPFEQRKSTDPKPGTEAAAVKADPKRETPGRSRTPGRASTDEHPVNYVPTPEDAKQAAARVAEREARDRAAQDATIRQWEAGHELDARRIRNEAGEWVEGNKFVPVKLREQTIETEYRRRALEAINGKAAA
jgi:hypothetical protein